MNDPQNPPDFDEQIHDLAGRIRAAQAALADLQGNPGLRLQLSAEAYAQSPVHALLIVTQMATLWFDKINQQLRTSGRQPMAFPTDLLKKKLGARSGTSRRDAASDVVAFLEISVDEILPDQVALEDLIRVHGLFAFQRMLHAGLLIGELLAEVDPDLETLEGLLATQALSDELDWERERNDDTP